MITHNPYLTRLAALSDDDLLQQARGSIYNVLHYKTTRATYDAIWFACSERGLGDKFLAIVEELKAERNKQRNEQYERVMRVRKEGYKSE